MSPAFDLTPEGLSNTFDKDITMRWLYVSFNHISEGDEWSEICWVCVDDILRCELIYLTKHIIHWHLASPRAGG